MPGQNTSSKKYMSDKWAHYTWQPEECNHSVTIIGWDDNYPKENFLGGHQPEGNGAFLIKNSWGSELNEFPNNGYRHWGLLEGQDGIKLAEGTKHFKYGGYHRIELGKQYRAILSKKQNYSVILREKDSEGKSYYPFIDTFNEQGSRE